MSQICPQTSQLWTSYVDLSNIYAETNTYYPGLTFLDNCIEVRLGLYNLFNDAYKYNSC